MASSLLFILSSIFGFAFAWSSASATYAVPAIFVFGDSLADVGNNNYLNNTRVDFPPYGIDFPGHTPTGRFSNGYNNIDWLAKLVGYRQSPPPFLSLTNASQMLKGANFASGGSGIIDTTGTTLTFAEQITDYKSVVDDLVKQMGEERTNRLLSKSLFFISSGTNDMFGYYLTFGAQNATQNQIFIASLVDKFSGDIETIYKYGARKFGIIGISHIGCIPAMTSRNPTGRCIEDLNSLGRKFNTIAKAKMHDLSSMLGGMKYSYGNVYDLMTLAINKPQMFGFKEIESACCGSGKFNGVGPCGPNATLCPNRNQYLFWDQFHPTQAASNFVAMKFYGGSRRFATPINIKSLIKY